MPNPNSDDYLAAKLKDYGQRLANLENQQTFIVSDPQGVQRVRLGLQTNGDIGLSTTDPLGNSAEVFPLQANSVWAQEATSSTAWTDLATVGPTVTAWIGASGQALILASASVQTTSLNIAEIGISIDGGAAVMVGVVGILTGNNSDRCAGTASAVYVQPGLTPGQHTFKMQYQNTSAFSVDFAVRSLVVWPI